LPYISCNLFYSFSSIFVDSLTTVIYYHLSLVQQIVPNIIKRFQVDLINHNKAIHQIWFNSYKNSHSCNNFWFTKWNADSWIIYTDLKSWWM